MKTLNRIYTVFMPTISARCQATLGPNLIRETTEHVVSKVFASSGDGVPHGRTLWISVT